VQIRVITKLPNTEQSSKGKVKTHKSTNRQNQSTTGKLGNFIIKFCIKYTSPWTGFEDFIGCCVKCLTFSSEFGTAYINDKWQVTKLLETLEEAEAAEVPERILIMLMDGLNGYVNILLPKRKKYNLSWEILKHCSVDCDLYTAEQERFDFPKHEVWRFTRLQFITNFKFIFAHSKCKSLILYSYAWRPLYHYTTGPVRKQISTLAIISSILINWTCGIAIYIQSNLSYVTFQGNSEIWSHKTGGRLIQV